MHELDPEALAAVAAAYAIVLRARSTEAPAATPPWRLAARLAIADAADIRVRRSRWNASATP